MARTCLPCSQARPGGPAIASLKAIPSMKALTWRSVSGGIAALCAIILILVLVLTYARTGVLRGDKFRLYVAVADASNVLVGSDVWLNGQRVGTVVHIGFAPASAPLDQR